MHDSVVYHAVAVASVLAHVVESTCDPVTLTAASKRLCESVPTNALVLNALANELSDPVCTGASNGGVVEAIPTQCSFGAVSYRAHRVFLSLKSSGAQHG